MAGTGVAGARPATFGALVRSSVALLALGAGVIHLAAAGDHREHPLIFNFFVVVACLQVAWAAVLVTRPSRRVLAVGAAGSALVVIIWVMSRTTGVPLVAGAQSPEELGIKDTVCSLFEVLAVAGVGLLAAMPAVARRATVATVAARRALGAVGTVVLLLSVPAVVAEHHHHDELAGHHHEELAAHADHLDATPASQEHEHVAPTGHADHSRTAAQLAAATVGETAAHDHGEPPPDANTAVTNHGAHTGHAGHTGHAVHGAAPEVAHHDPTTGAAGDAGHVHGGAPAPASHVHDAGACRPTAAQQAAADKLVADTRASLARWVDQNQALADGYVPYPPVPAGWAQHYVDFGSLDDGRILDPRHPESLLYAATDEGFRPVSALYIMPHAGTHGPAIGGCLTHWHTHPEIFLSRPGEDGSPEMLHVFIVPMRGGPFAHEPDPQSMRDLYTPFRVLVSPWWRDDCEGAPWLPGNPYQLIPSCQGWRDGHPEAT